MSYFERDYASQEFVGEFQRKLESQEKSKQRKKFLKSLGTLILIGGISIGAIYKALDIAASESPKEIKLKPEETTSEALSGKSFEVAEPEKIKTARARKEEKELSSVESKSSQLEKSEFVQNLINEKYDQFNDIADFKITFDINDKDGEVQEMIERIGLTYGNPDHINLYKAIAAKESRLKWEHSIDGGMGYFQITNIPPSIEKEVSAIAERDKLTQEEANALAGAMTFERSLEYVRNQREQLGQKPNEAEETLLAIWAYNIGPKHLDLAKDFEGNYQKFSGEHRDYALEVLAFESALERGYRR